MKRRYHLINGKLIKAPKYHDKRANEKVNTHSTTTISTKIVGDRPSEPQEMGEGFNYRSVVNPVHSMKKQVQRNTEIVSGLGLLNFSTPSMRSTKSKNIKIII